MDNWTPIEKMTDSEFLQWLEKQQLYGLTAELKKRYAKYFEAYHSLKNGLDKR